MGSGSGPTLPALIGALDVAAVLVDPKTGAILTASPGVEALSGRPAEALEGRQLRELTAPTDGRDDWDPDRLITAAAGEPQNFEWCLERATGETVWTRVRIELVTVDGIDCLLISLRDITAYHELSERLRLYYRILQHTLRNEMNLVLGYCDLARAAVEDPTVAGHLDTIAEAAERVVSLSRSLEDFEAVTEREQAVRMPMDVTEVVGVVVAKFREDFPSAQVCLDVPDAAWARLDVSFRLALQQVLENAIVHTDKESPRIRIDVKDRADVGRIEIEIIDDGPGIPEIELESLGEFERVGKVSHGSGFGLWVTVQCVESLGGGIEFNENELGGTTVCVKLPRVDPSSEPAIPRP